MAKKQFNYHIDYTDGSANFNFFTTAYGHKSALKNLQKNSFDFNNLCKDNADITIRIKRLKS